VCQQYHLHFNVWVSHQLGLPTLVPFPLHAQNLGSDLAGGSELGKPNPLCIPVFVPSRSSTISNDSLSSRPALVGGSRSCWVVRVGKTQSPMHTCICTIQKWHQQRWQSQQKAGAGRWFSCWRPWQLVHCNEFPNPEYEPYLQDSRGLKC
jgi:hypothetical protein